jgi:hypothetical protein
MVSGANGLQSILAHFVEEEIAICENDRFLGLALPKDAPEPDAALRGSLVENQTVKINSRTSL